MTPSGGFGWSSSPTVTRVSSIAAGFFGRVARDEDAFPVDATVQSAWRELQGGADESQR